MSAPAPARTDLYRTLADPVRLKVLALLTEEELAVGELAELLAESQPQVSKKVAALRKMSLIEARKDGTRTYLRAARSDDPVILDAVAEGSRLSLQAGALQRVPEVVAAREEAGRAFFEQADAVPPPAASTVDKAYVYALSRLLPANRLAIDAGTGDGAFLEVLAPAYDRVIAVDRSKSRLAQAAARVSNQGLHNVRLVEASLDDVNLLQEVDATGGADALTLARTLHHSSRPQETLAQAARLLRPGGALILVDYLPHTDEAMREQGDVWLGFDADQLAAMLAAAGLSTPGANLVPRPFIGPAYDAHLTWQVLIAEKAA